MSSITDLERPLESVAFLARSPSRFRVLEAIRSEPRTRNELKAMTDISRFTLSRILADLEARGWIVRAGNRYEPTGKGTIVVSEFETLLANLDVAEELNGALDWLQTDEFGFDLERLRDADVITPTHTDHTAPIRRAAELVRGADRFRGIATGVAYEMMDAIWETTVHGELTMEGILDASTFEAIKADRDLRGQFREIADIDRAELFRYDGDVTLVMMILCDDTVMMCGHDEDGPAPGTIKTTDVEVRSWAASYLDDVRADARPLDAGAFGS